MATIDTTTPYRQNAVAFVVSGLLKGNNPFTYADLAAAYIAAFGTASTDPIYLALTATYATAAEAQAALNILAPNFAQASGPLTLGIDSLNIPVTADSVSGSFGIAVEGFVAELQPALPANRWGIVTPQDNVGPNAFTVGVTFNPQVMQNPVIRYSDLHYALTKEYTLTPTPDYPMFPGSPLETLVNLLAGPSYDLDAINAAGCAVMSLPQTGTIGATTGLVTAATVLGVARDGYFDFTEALKEYIGASTTIYFRLNAAPSFTVEQEGGCSVVLRGNAFKQTKRYGGTDLNYTRGTVGVPVTWSQLAAALQPDNLVAQFAAGNYPTPADFQRAAAEAGILLYSYGATTGATANIALGDVAPWGFTIGVYLPAQPGITVSPYANGLVALNPVFADGDLGSNFIRISCQHSIIQ